MCTMSENLDTKAVDNFKKYLRIPSVQPDCNYSECVEFLQKTATSLGDSGLPVVVQEVAPGKPVVVITWVGSQPELPSLLLSSHMDVVPVVEDLWTYDPFSAEEDGDGNIYARGSQDMKCVGIQYLEAIRRLLLRKFQPERTIHVCFTPDEEIGCQGMKIFVETSAFKNLHIGCVLDEGGPSEDESYFLFYGERTNLQIRVSCKGTEGHGSMMMDNTAGEKFVTVIDEFMKKRAEEKKKQTDNPKPFVSDGTTINLTIVEGGVQTNVLPSELTVTFDIRVSLDQDLEEFDRWIRDVCERAGQGVTFEYLTDRKKVEPTNLNKGNIWWTTLKAKFDEMGMTVNPCILPGNTDAKYCRSKGIPAFNFSPMNFTPMRIHANDEYLNKKVFLKGIDIYCEIITAMANVKG